MGKPGSQGLNTSTLLFRISQESSSVCLHNGSIADERGMTRRKKSGGSLEWRGAMDGRITLGNALARIAVGLFVHAFPSSWWPRWLRELVGKDKEDLQRCSKGQFF